ncbi:MAG: putative ABC transporter permease [Faecalibacterium sp.]
MDFLFETTVSCFSIYELLAYFLIYSFLGWCLEVIFAAVTTGELANRGFLNGPLCPIYGLGMDIVLLALTPVQGSLLALYLGGVLLPSALELVAGWTLYKAFHTRWWDYSDYPFNLGGYICLEFCLLWGVGVVLMLRVIHPIIAGLVALVPHLVGTILLGVLFVIFVVDLVATFVAAMGLTKALEALEKAADSIHDVSDAITEILGGTALDADQKMDEQRLQLKLAAAEVRDAASRLSARDAVAAMRTKAEEAAARARRSSQTALLNAEEAAEAAKLAAQGKAERASELLDLEKLRTELQVRVEEFQERLTRTSPLVGKRRLIRAYPRLKLGRKKLTLDALREKLRRSKEAGSGEKKH